MRLTLISLVTFSVFACKSGHSGDSDLNFSKAAFDAVDDITFSPDQLPVICAQNSLIVFVGNGEQMGASAVFPKKGAGTLTDATIKDFADIENRNHEKFVESITIGMADLKRQLAKESCGGGDGTTTYAEIFDGPAIGDSRIDVTMFDRKGTKIDAETVSLSFVDKKLEERKNGAKFELNMARDVPLILKGIRDRKAGDKAYTQITYFFKSHGAAFKKSVGTGHVLLFDTNGPDGKLTSNLWYKVWSPAAVEQLCPLPVAQTNPNFKFCVAMRSEYQTVSGVGSDPTGGVGSDPSAGAGSDPSAGAGSDPSAGAGSDPSAGAGSDPSAGAGSDPSAGPGTDPAAGPGTDPAAGPGTDPAAGRSTVDMGDPNQAGDIFTADANPKMAQGYVMLGEAASYTMKEAPANLKGVQPLIIPVAKKGAGGAVRQPVLIVFDSCQMSNDLDQDTLVAKADGVTGIGGLGKEQGSVLALVGDKLDQPVITVANPYPLYYFAVNYGLFEAKHYKALPYVFYWGLPTGKDKDGHPTFHRLSSDSVKKGAVALDTAIGTTGLDRERIIEKHSDPDPEQRTKLKKEYSRLVPKLSSQVVAAQDD